MHAETVRIVNSQIDDLGVRMAALDDFVARAREQNESHHADCLRAVEELSDSVGTSYGTVGTHYKAAVSRMQTLDAEMETETRALHAAAEPLHETLGGPLASLRKEIQATRLQEYEPTGDTPARGASYEYPTTLPRTEDHDVLIARLHDEDDASVLPKSKPATPSRPSRSRSHHHDHATVTTTTTVPVVFSDPVDHPQAAAATNKGICTPAPRPPIFSASLGTADRHSLREVNPNSLLSFDASVSVNGGGKGNGDTTIMSFVGDSSTAPLVKKKSNSRLPKGGSRRQGTPAADKAATPVAEGRENVPPAALASSLGAGGPRRKSPRLN